MGKIVNNPVTTGFSGTLGKDLIFRQVNSETTYAQRNRSPRPATVRMLAVREKFTEATIGAKGALADPATKDHYEKMAVLQKAPSAYSAALKDILSEPEIGGIYTGVYFGEIGNNITIIPELLGKVTGIEVAIYSADGTLLESGPATEVNYAFMYKAQAVNPQVAGSKIVLTAKDRLRKTLVREFVL
ncbi:hypothetical protein [Chryseosolibacter indicus]|uniref:Uncharacterized protein n=1 Tax=Chryseosolibacter indicus TaxID=2782351 RepID=A0ABS5VU31_9BACT|nr:hypothetical protein [Chryseosolibacter indicus]MBT1704927.1 hypothetical protein [Chryseosolibacter indicus]